MYDLPESSCRIFLEKPEEAILQMYARVHTFGLFVGSLVCWFVGGLKKVGLVVSLFLSLLICWLVSTKLTVLMRALLLRGVLFVDLSFFRLSASSSCTEDDSLSAMQF